MDEKCPGCGKAFKRSRPNQRFCTGQCKKTHEKGMWAWVRWYEERGFVGRRAFGRALARQESR